MTTTPHANQGKAFEALIELSNAFYARQKIAYVQKVHVKKIESGGSLIYPEKSTVDYIGCWRGKFIAFDAKSTKGDKQDKERPKAKRARAPQKKAQGNRISNRPKIRPDKREDKDDKGGRG